MMETNYRMAHYWSTTLIAMFVAAFLIDVAVGSLLASSVLMVDHFK